MSRKRTARAIVAAALILALVPPIAQAETPTLGGPTANTSESLPSSRAVVSALARVEHTRTPKSAREAHDLLRRLPLASAPLYPQQLPPGFARSKIRITWDLRPEAELHPEYSVEWASSRRAADEHLILVRAPWDGACPLMGQLPKDIRGGPDSRVRRTTVRHLPAVWVGDGEVPFSQLFWCEHGAVYAVAKWSFAAGGKWSFERADWRSDRLQLRALVRALEPVEHVGDQ
jgi:hypothetical protein